ncbi:hypothetical protein SAMN04487965_0417 [Microbulbifer donghaiensis]|uniref:Uncharacterized protein n=1 Tax=Microbulbifer donghaiensis TaxID=494016 RepID=A0A1M4VFV4_9GAMM|nr:hypothetical protein [Microbulbifer donghaiensis]SHE67896.1 hypothetical protein SAMN04487965_0417 [Microbulbifer donghaiensis]
METEAELKQTNEFSGVLVLHIWSVDRDRYITLYRGSVTLRFQPLKGMRIVSDTNYFTIHDIEWDIEENTFRAYIVQVEHNAFDSFIDMKFLIEEAERVGWKRAKGRLGGIQDAEDTEFIDYCFPLSDIRFQEIESKDREERFKEVVLNSLTKLGSKLHSMESLRPLTLITGVVLGVVISAVVQAVL